MRIKRTENQTSNFPIVGKVKIGMKHPEKGYPMSLDYFRATSQNQKYEALFLEAHGEKPSTIPIVFLASDENACKEFLELRDSAGKLLAEGDGENFKVVHNGIWHEVNLETIQKRAEWQTPEGFMNAMLQKAGAKGVWKETLRLRFILPQIKGLFGLWELRTHAVASSIPQIVSYFDTVLQSTKGRIAMIPFDLSVKKVKSDKAGESKQFSVISMVCNLSVENLSIVGNFTDVFANGILTDDKVRQIAQNNTPLQIVENTENANYETLS